MAHASKHAAISHKRAEEMVRQLELEIEKLTQKAEDAGSVPLDTGLRIPDETKRREDRKAKLPQARKVIEERYVEVRGQKQEDYEAKKRPATTSVQRERNLVDGNLSLPRVTRRINRNSTSPTEKAGS